MWGCDGHMGWGWMGIWWIVILMAIAAVVWFAMTAARRNGGLTHEETPEQVLKRRYARGQIDREEYQRLREELKE